ncbi:hypothetical protein N665_0939s0004 [Sinapis alba]|nr:hypothetical protein N665_0939s0004 [Sinapis alba]
MLHWKSPNNKIGIGWSLCSKESTSRLQGRSSMEPTNSSLSAVQQLYKLAYINITFIGDCLKLIMTLQSGIRGKDDQLLCHPHVDINLVKDIETISLKSHFNFDYVPRNLIVC